ncbi:hypothetical protein AB3X96_38830 [Paraburkholderia sp. BR13439]|uniref:hypothetical protein n=1 Tax=Paraburkholderia TaxID=1822464 RepID=UPI0034CE0F96
MGFGSSFGNLLGNAGAGFMNGMGMGPFGMGGMPPEAAAGAAIDQIQQGAQASFAINEAQQQASLIEAVGNAAKSAGQAVEQASKPQ